MDKQAVFAVTAKPPNCIIDGAFGYAANGIHPIQAHNRTLNKYINAGVSLEVVALFGHTDRVYLKGLADTTNLAGDFYVAQ